MTRLFYLLATFLILLIIVLLNSIFSSEIVMPFLFATTFPSSELPTPS